MKLHRTWACTASRLVRSNRTYRGYASAAKPEIFDVVCVGGGPAGLSLLAGLRKTEISFYRAKLTSILQGLHQ